MKLKLQQNNPLYVALRTHNNRLYRDWAGSSGKMYNLPFWALSHYIVVADAFLV